MRNNFDTKQGQEQELNNLPQLSVFDFSDKRLVKISEKYEKIFEIAKLEIGNSVSGPSSGAVSNCFGGMENTLNTVTKFSTGW